MNFCNPFRIVSVLLPLDGAAEHWQTWCDMQPEGWIKELSNSQFRAEGWDDHGNRFVAYGVSDPEQLRGRKIDDFVITTRIGLDPHLVRDAELRRDYTRSIRELEARWMRAINVRSKAA